MRIEYAIQRIIKIHPTGGVKYIVYAMVSYPDLPACEQIFPFFTKHAAVTFCKAHP